MKRSADLFFQVCGFLFAPVAVPHHSPARIAAVSLSKSPSPGNMTGTTGVKPRTADLKKQVCATRPRPAPHFKPSTK